MENPDFDDPQGLKTPEPIDIKLDKGDYVGDITLHIKLVLDRYCVSVSIHSLLYSIGEYDISVCVSPPIPIRPLR